MAAPRIQELAPLWEARLQELLTRFDVPGAVLGVSHRGERVLTAGGVAGLRNPQPVGVDTIFQLGSISKVYTATLLMALTGPEILKRSVAELVPEADWMEPEIRVLHLLTHSSGLGGDHFADTGRGDDALARYVQELARLPRDIPPPPGSRYSYCNSGYSVLGRLIEILSGDTYDATLRGRLLDPLGVSATVTLPEDAILHPVALGHNRSDPDPLRADGVWNFARSCNPLGGICASAGDLLTFAELHLRDGRGADGITILPPGVAGLMRGRHLDTPPLSRPSARGLGWGIDDLDGGRELVGHDGETLGQIASLRLLPDEQLAVVVLTNAIPDGDEVTGALLEAVLAPWGLTPPRIDVPARDATVAFDPQPYLGRYRNLESIFDVSADDQGLVVTARTIAEGLEESTDVTRLIPLGGAAFVEADVARPTRARSFDDRGADGRFRSYFAGRIAWRVPAGDE